LPAAGVDSRGDVRLAKESLIRDHRIDGLPGLMTVVGVRYTTARLTAERTVDAVGVALNRALAASRTATTPLVGGDVSGLEAFLERAAAIGAGVGAGVNAAVPAGVDAGVARRLASTYGTEYSRVLDVLRASDDLATPLGGGSPVTGGEVIYSAREEMAERLTDVVLRRTELGSAACPPRGLLERAAALMAAERGWDASRIATEIDEVEARYRIPS
jgi:glycerol-3-phosphate dehydrogenase